MLKAVKLWRTVSSADSQTGVRHVFGQKGLIAERSSGCRDRGGIVYHSSAASAQVLIGYILFTGGILSAYLVVLVAEPLDAVDCSCAIWPGFPSPDCGPLLVTHVCLPCKDLFRQLTTLAVAPRFVLVRCQVPRTVPTLLPL